MHMCIVLHLFLFFDVNCIPFYWTRNVFRFASCCDGCYTMLYRALLVVERFIQLCCVLCTVVTWCLARRRDLLCVVHRCIMLHCVLCNVASCCAVWCTELHCVALCCTSVHLDNCSFCCNASCCVVWCTALHRACGEGGLPTAWAPSNALYANGIQVQPRGDKPVSPIKQMHCFRVWSASCFPRRDDSNKRVMSVSREMSIFDECHLHLGIFTRYLPGWALLLQSSGGTFHHQGQRRFF